MRYPITGLSILLVSTTCLHAQDWEVSSVATGSRPSLDVDAQGNPHVAYVYQSPAGWIRYAVWDPLTMAFDTSEIGTGNLEGPAAIGLDQADIPHVVYHRHDPPPEQVHAFLSGSTWLSEDITDPNHDGWDNSIAFDSNNLPRTSSIDPSSYPASTGVEYAWYDGASWHVEQIGSALVSFFGGTSIAIDSADNPHITYYDDLSGDLMYAVKENNAWTIVPVETDGDAGRFSSLELDSQGRPVISYYKGISASSGSVRLAEFNGSSWVFSTIDTLTNMLLGTARSTTSLELDGLDNPHISYGDREVVKYATRIGGNWEREIVADYSSGSTILGQITSLGLGSEGEPHIVFDELASIGVVKYATKQSLTEVGDNNDPLSEYKLLQNYPNPFNAISNFEFRISNLSDVSLIIYDVLGREVAILVNERLSSGTYSRRWDATGQPSGVYFYRLSTIDFVQTRKLVLLR